MIGKILRLLALKKLIDAIRARRRRGNAGG